MDKNKPSRLHRWVAGPTAPVLNSGDVHVWRAPLSLTDRDDWGILSSDERERADRFKFEKDRVRYVAAHAVLRRIIERYLQRPASALEFRHNTHGKPELGCAGQTRAPLRFNISHSRCLGLFAFASSSAVGVDLEAVDGKFECEKLARRYFARGEADRLADTPEVDRLDAFFRCWTRKEAYVKARGTGLYLPLDKFEVGFRKGEPAGLLHVDGEPDAPGRWTIVDVDAAVGFAAALAVEARDVGVRCYDWSRRK